MPDKQPITAVIIDDDLNAIDLLEAYLRHFADILLVGKESDAREGLELVKLNPPDLIFLDIDMPDMNGLTLADRIQSVNFYPEIVFTTAHQHYAYDALGIEPLDFLTKPFLIEDVELVISKYKAKTEQKNYQKKLDSLILAQNNPITIKLPSLKGILFVDIKDIVVLSANLHYTDIILSDGSKETIIKTINKLAALINSPSFFQISRSAFINLNYLHRIERKGMKCFLNVNNKLIEEKMSRGAINLFEKVVPFPFNIEKEKSAGI
jgi:two-component system LytT family response regulator